jgi:hypothetical protein
MMGTEAFRCKGTRENVGLMLDEKARMRRAFRAGGERNAEIWRCVGPPDDALSRQLVCFHSGQVDQNEDFYLPADESKPGGVDIDFVG